MLKKVSASTMLNLGSLAAFIAFPLLYAAAFGDSPGILAFGMVFIAFSMFAPFIAGRCGS